MVSDMHKSGNVVFLGEPGQQSSETVYPSVTHDHVTATLISRCRDLAAQSLPKLLCQLFDALDDDLYKLSENATNDTSQATYFNAMRSLRVFRHGLEKSFAKTVLDNYDEFWRSGGLNVLITQAQPETTGELSLIGEEELEEKLAVTSMIDKANNRFQRSLYALNKRFSAMLGLQRIEDGRNPLGPLVIANAFKQEMSAWDGEIVIRIVIYKLFDKHVVSNLDSFYEELNQLLVAAGIMPDIHQAQGHHRPPPTDFSGQHVPQEAVAETPTAGVQEQAIPTMQELWGYMQQMMAAQHSGATLFEPGSPVPAHLPVLSKRSVVDELSALQQQIHATPVSQYANIKLAQEALRDELLHRFGTLNEEAGHQHRLGEKEQQTMDVILMLFNQVLDDPNLPDTMRAILARLQIPVLKAAIEDDSFIENKDHPARQLINSLAKACVGWVDDGDRSDECLYGKVKAAVDRILNEYDDDISLFVQVNREFGEYMAQSARVAAAVERRVTQTIEGEDRLQASRRKVTELLDRYRMEQLPAIAQRLLNDPWRKLLTITLLREGEESPAWKDAVTVVDDLVKSVLPGEAGANRDELLKVIPKLGNKLKEGFAYISYNAADSRKLLNELQACHIEMIRSKGPRPDANGMLKPVAERSPETQSERNVQARITDEEPVSGSEKQSTDSIQAVAAEDEYDRQVATIGEGQWIRMTYRDKEITGKLVWRSKFTGTMLFVDGQGKKVAQINEKDLSALFRAGKSSKLEDPETPIMDRALGRMMKLFHGRSAPATQET